MTQVRQNKFEWEFEDKMAAEAQCSLLLKSVEDWNRWRQQGYSLDVDLSQIDLRQARLARANLSQANLSQANLSGVNLRRANCAHTNLRRATLAQANAYKIDLSSADLRRTNLQRINLRQARLTQSRLSGADLFGAELCGADLRGAQLIGANLVGIDLTGADLTDANLTGANLKGATLTQANFTNATLFHTNLASITWSDLVLSGAKFRNNLGLTSVEQAAIRSLGGTLIPRRVVRKTKPRHMIVLRDMQGQRIFHLDAGIYRIGRDNNSDIRLSDQTVSRCHALLLRLNDESSDSYYYRLVDGDGRGNFSQNGTLVNRHRCSFHNLKSGDYITVGRTTLEYLLQELTDRQLADYVAMMERPGIPSVPDLSVKATMFTL